MRFLATVLFAVIVLSGAAQSPNDFPTENANWTNLLFTYWWSGPMEGSPNNYGLLANPQFSISVQDTLIGGLSYNQMFLNDSLYQGATRNSGDSVFFVLHDEMTESLLYYFGASEGDSIFSVMTGNMGLEGLDWDEYELRDYRVTQVDTVMYADGIERRRLYLDYGNVQWVQGIGNMQGLFWYGGINVSNYVDDLVRFCKDDQIVLLEEPWPFFPIDDTSCYSGFTTGATDLISSKFSVFPNPTSDVLYVNSLDGRKFFQFRIFDSAGNLVFEENKQDDSEIMLDLSNLPSGLYYLQIADENTNAGLVVVKE